jgi:hypothetical protein
VDRETREHAVWVARLRHELRALRGRWSTVPGLANVPEWRSDSRARFLEVSRTSEKNDTAEHFSSG